VQCREVKQVRKRRFIAELVWKWRRAYIVQETLGNILSHATWSHVTRVQTCTGNTLVKLHQLLALLESPEEGSHRTNVKGMAANSEEVIKDTGDLAEDYANVLSTEGNIGIQKLLNGKGVSVLLSHHRDIIKAIEVRESLEVVLALDKLFGTTVEKADVRIGAFDDLTIELKNQS
jgi:hypothetical protein